ncbi:MAG: hypothetical protein WC627_01495 [Legionella sp.]
MKRKVDYKELESAALKAYSLFAQEISVPDFLFYVVRDQKNELKKLLYRLSAEDVQKLLLGRGTCTDYSGRIFECSAYEYAYWTMDEHMCRFLEGYMDSNTKTEVLKRCFSIEESGLLYQHASSIIRDSKHFDFKPLKTALKEYIDGFDTWFEAGDWKAMEDAWIKVGFAQRNTPVYVAYEYCRPRRSFFPLPEFNEEYFPCSLVYTNPLTNKQGTWFPLNESITNSLGYDFAIYRGDYTGAGQGERCNGPRPKHVKQTVMLDYQAICQLEKVRTSGLVACLERLSSIEEADDYAQLS